MTADDPGSAKATRAAQEIVGKSRNISRKFAPLPTVEIVWTERALAILGGQLFDRVNASRATTLSRRRVVTDALMSEATVR